MVKCFEREYLKLFFTEKKKIIIKFNYKIIEKEQNIR